MGAFRINEVGLVVGSTQRRRPEDENPADWSLLSLLAAPATAMGVPCVGVERDFDREKSLGIYTYSYQGTQNNFTFDDRHISFEFDVTMSEDPIESHPNFGKLKTKYGWIANKRRFAEFLPESGVGAEAGFGLSGNSSKGGKRSPLYGVDSFLAVGATFSKTYLRGAVPPSVLRGIGTIGTPPGIGAFHVPKGAAKRNWLKLAPLIRKKGNCVQITERWMLSGPKGWLKEMYGLAQLEEDFEDLANAAQ